MRSLYRLATRMALLVIVLSLLGAAGLSAAGAEAAEIRVLTTGAFRPVLDALVPAFESRSGNQVKVETDTAGGVAARIARGDAFDIAVLTPATAQNPERDGRIILVTPIASVGIGVAVRMGAPKPDISSVAALKATLLAAPSVAMVDPASGGSSGIYLAKMFERLGIADQMKSKLVLTQGGLPGESVADGHAVLALGQASELLAVSGVTLVGPIPAELQNRTVYVAALNPKAGDASLILLAALAGPETQAILPQKGMGPP
jgi:molybdate transport system substrate-binding protein